MTFLFDIGNVLLKLHFERFTQTILGSSQPQLPPTLDTLKNRYETGQLTDQKFIESSLQTLAPPPSPTQFIAAWQDIFTANEPMWEVVRNLKKKGHRLILFSNTNNLHVQRFLADYRDFALFDHQHYSHHTGAIKPDPDFYHRAIATYDLVPAKTAYLDDLAENIATGIALGFQCHQYDLTDHQAALDWLSALKK